MNIYISGISGTGMGPLALMAKQAGFNVCGSDLSKGAIYDELIGAGIEVFIGEQNGDYLKTKIAQGIDWFCYTSALPADHPELVVARNADIKCTKRDDLTAFLVDELNLKMVAVAGTHGKTTTTAMIIWAALQLKLPVSYIVGSTLGFAPSGAYHKGDQFFIYEADEYDRNFLKYNPWLAVIPSISYDHPDIYKTKADYENAFLQFKSQSEYVIEYKNNRIMRRIIEDGEEYDDEVLFRPNDFKLAGEARRIDAALAATAVHDMENYDDEESLVDKMKAYPGYIVEAIDRFPGVGRRFEKLQNGLYTDYAHHPEEIKATVEIAMEQAKIEHKKGVVVIYEPHQNTRQHEVREGYRGSFVGVDKVLWLPTYLTREDPNLEVLKPEDFIKDLVNAEQAEVAELGDDLEEMIKKYLSEDYLVILMTAGPADAWLRKRFSEN